MQSKTLCFNRTLFRKNLSRFWPLWAVPSFVGALFPLAMLTHLIRYGVDGMFGSGSGSYYNQGVNTMSAMDTALSYATRCLADNITLNLTSK